MDALAIPLLFVLAATFVGYVYVRRSSGKGEVSRAAFQNLRAEVRSLSNDRSDAASAIQGLRRNIAAMHAQLNTIESRELALSARLDALEYGLGDTE